MELRAPVIPHNALFEPEKADMAQKNR